MEIVLLHPEVRKFIDSLQEIDRIRTWRMVEVLRDKGHYITMPYSKKVNHKLYELRISASVNIRIFYTFYHNQWILLHGFIKKSVKIPLKELHTAINRMNDLA